MKVPFNKPLILGEEQLAISKVFEANQFSGNGPFTHTCQQFLKSKFSYKKALLTTSCTSALELSALLLNLKEGDEVIVPSYAFVTTANAFASKGATIVFADSRANHPAIDEAKLEQLITPKTKAIVALQYGGMACEMDSIMEISQKHSILVIEDNAQGIGATYKGRPLGGIGDLGALSFHETKNVHCGEGGAIVVSNEQLLERTRTIWDMGTNRAAFNQGKVDSYGWVDVGSSFYPSELNAAFLSSQLPFLHEVNEKRIALWNNYYEALVPLAAKEKFELPNVPALAEHNGHIFYLIMPSKQERDGFIQYLSEKGISTVFHFQSLHKSPYFKDKYKGPKLANADRYSDCLVRLPLYYGLTSEEQAYVVETIQRFYTK